MVTGVGAYEIDGKSYPWAALADGESSEPIQFSLAQGVEAPPVFQVVQADLEITSDRGKLKKRCHGWTLETIAPKEVAK
jgi:hypothetical protein